MRKRFESDDAVSIKEVRNIFFSRPLKAEDKDRSPKPIKSEAQPDFHHELRPNAKLLFRYSALTFNTHAIRRDVVLCHEVEHYPDLIVHGPLSFTLLTTLLRHHLDKEASKKVIKHIKYGNTHPLFNEQTIKVCGRKKSEDEYELWEESEDGNVAVQYTATVEEISTHDL
ncbi:hypothetical protein ANO11243_093330 [Dothideomycetidae sp. 11243]|nr:hypothetical protein ANO11243_093330 [fungal sp. No.11243]